MNEAIRGVSEIRVIGPNGENIGVITVQEALRIAREAEKDLVEVSPNASPPVCRILDYGKFLYEKSKKEKEARKAQKTIEVKEIRLRPKTTDHHRSFKVRAARGWLLEGMKVKVRIRFRGREITYPEIAREELREVATELADVGVVEVTPDMEGRTMLMILAPSRKVAVKPAAEKPARPAPAKDKPAEPVLEPPLDDDDDDDETGEAETTVE
ncbi:MAG: translation initiation factor IF-3 [Chloroflexota bacterium]